MLVQEQRAEGERIARYHALELPGGEMSAVLDRQDRRFTMDAELELAHELRRADQDERTARPVRCFGFARPVGGRLI